MHYICGNIVKELLTLPWDHEEFHMFYITYFILGQLTYPPNGLFHHHDNWLGDGMWCFAPVSPWYFVPEVWKYPINRLVIIWCLGRRSSLDVGTWFGTCRVFFQCEDFLQLSNYCLPT